MNIGEILSTAWKITWKHKILWLFGFFIIGWTFAWNGILSLLNTIIELTRFKGKITITLPLNLITDQLVDSSETLENISGASVSIVFIILIVIYFLLMFLLSNLGGIGVIKGTSLVDNSSETEGALSLKTIVSGQKGSFWKVLLLQLGFGLVMTICMLFVFFLAILVGSCAICAGLIVVFPGQIFFRLIYTLAAIAVVDETIGVRRALERSWSVLKKGFGKILSMAVIIGAGSLVCSFVINSPLLLLSTNVLNAGMTKIGFLKTETIVPFLIILFIILIPLMTLLASILFTYAQVAWTLTYRRLAAEQSLEPEVIQAEGKDAEME